MNMDRIQTLLGRVWHGADYNYEQWLHAPEVLDEDFRLMKLAGCTAMSVGIFSWAMIEPEDGIYRFDWLNGLLDRLDANGIRAILATPSAAHPAWLSRAYPEVLRVNRDGSREKHRGRQVFCRTSPVFRLKTLQINERLAERFALHPALLLWHVSNEYGSSPCYCAGCVSDFHRWLRERYGDLQAVNDAWWTTFWSHRYSAWEEIWPADSSNNGLMLDWQRYNSDQVLDFYLHETGPLRKWAPDIPITTNFMRPDVGLNYWKIARHVDVISWDSYPEWHVGDDIRTAAETAFYHDLHRGYGQGRPFYLLETSPAQTNWQPLSRLKRPGMVELASIQGVAHGAMGVNYFQWRQSRGGEEKFHGAVVLNREQETSRTFRSVQRVGELLAGIPGVSAGLTRARVGLVYDFENEWALNLAHLPRAAAREYQAVCIDYYRAFWRRGIAVDLIPASGAFGGYDLIVAPMLYMLSAGTAAELAAFAAAGGTLLTTFLTGWVGETDLVHLGGYPQPLGEVLGLRMTEFDTFGPGEGVVIRPVEGVRLSPGLTGEASRYAELLEPAGAEVLAVYDGEFYGGRAAMTLNRYGEGLAIHIGAYVSEDFLDEWIGRLAGELDLAPDVRGDIAEGVSVRVRHGNDADYLFMMNFAAKPNSAPLPDDSWVPVVPGGVDGGLPAYGFSVWKRLTKD